MAKSAGPCAVKAASAACCLLLLQPLLMVMAARDIMQHQTTQWTVESIYNNLAVYDSSAISDSQLWPWRNSTTLSVAAGLLPGDDAATTWEELYSKFDNWQTTLGWVSRYPAYINSPVCFQPQTATLGETLAALVSSNAPDSTETRDEYAAILNSLFSMAKGDDGAEDPKLSELLNSWTDQGRSMLSDVTKEQSLAITFVAPTTYGSVISTTIAVELAAGTIPNRSPADATPLAAAIPPQPFVKSVSVDSRELAMSVYSPEVSAGVWEKLQAASPTTGPLSKLRGPIDLGSSFKPLPLSVTSSECNNESNDDTDPGSNTGLFDDDSAASAGSSAMFLSIIMAVLAAMPGFLF